MVRKVEAGSWPAAPATNFQHSGREPTATHCARGVNCEMVLGETPSDERDQIIADFCAGRVTALVTVMVLSYGFNVPRVDFVAMLRPTCSTGLYVQQVGRGIRRAEALRSCIS